MDCQICDVIHVHNTLSGHQEEMKHQNGSLQIVLFCEKFVNVAIKLTDSEAENEILLPRQGHNMILM